MNAPQMTRPSYASWPPPASASNQPVAPQAAVQQYYVFSADNNHVGPVSADLIARGVAAGKVQNDALVAPVGSTQWVALTSIPELAAALAIHAPSLGNHDRFQNPPSHSNMRPASQPGTMLVQQAPQAPRLPTELSPVHSPVQPLVHSSPVQPSVAPAEPVAAVAPVASPLEIPPPKAEAAPAKEEKQGLDPRFKLLPLAIFGCFAFVGVIETALALIFIK